MSNIIDVLAREIIDSSGVLKVEPDRDASFAQYRKSGTIVIL